MKELSGIMLLESPKLIVEIKACQCLLGGGGCGGGQPKSPVKNTLGAGDSQNHHNRQKLETKDTGKAGPHIRFSKTKSESLSR